MDYLTSLKRDSKWSLRAWQERSSYPEARLDIQHVNQVILRKKKSASKVRGELIRSQNKYRAILISFQRAQELFIQYLKKDIIELRGIHKNSRGHPEKFPLGTLRSPGFNFLFHDGSCVSNEWHHLEVKREDILKIWPSEICPPLKKSQRTTLDEIASKYVLLQKDPANPKGRLLRSELKKCFPCARTQDIDIAIKIGNKILNRRRGAPKKLAKK